MNEKPICIYHDGCADGFAAAWAVRKFFAGEVDFHPGIYGEAPPEVAGREVILVDFSYKRDTMLPLIEHAKSVLIIDHHKTAEEDLRDLPAKALTVFDMHKSGAMLTWQHLFPGKMAPILFDHIQDRDLWLFHLPLTREIIAAAYSYPMTFEAWDELLRRPMLELEQEGRVIERKHRADVAALVKNASRRINFGSVSVPVANVPWMYASDVGGELAKGEPFAATYYDDADGRRWSLRSTADGADVSAIAKALGGGGHRNAAGFRMTREEAADCDATGGLA